MELLIELEKVLSNYIKPQTYPVAIKMLMKDDSIPNGIKFPLQSFGCRVAPCMCISLSRRYGWITGIRKEDVHCPLASSSLGFSETKDYLLQGKACASLYTESEDAGIISESMVPRLPLGKYTAILIAPINKSSFIPDMVMIYGNSAQMMRLIQGRLYKKGGRLTFSAQGRMGSCTEGIVQTIQTDECQLVIPSPGDRVFAMTSDDELIFTIPYDKLEEVINGLEETHKNGIRYPTPYWLRFSPKFPKNYSPLE